MQTKAGVFFMKNKTLTKFLSMSKTQQVGFIFATFAFAFLITSYVIGTFCTLMSEDKSPLNSLIVGMTTQLELVITLSIFATIMLLAIIFLKKRSMRNSIESEKDGVFFATDKNSGASRWQTEEEIKQNFKVGKVEDTTSVIYGRLKTYGSDQVVSWKAPEKLSEKQLRSGMRQAPEGNRNVLVIATMGSGKTFTYVENEIIQTVLRGDSFVVTDPKGEIFNNLTKFCQDRGVEVHTINLVEPKYSEFWNCLRETINPDTERLDATRLDEFAQIYMENATASDKKDFWFSCSLNLVKTCIGYIAWQRETDLINKYLLLYKKVANVTSDTITENALQKEHSMPYFKNLIREKAKENGYDLDEIEKIIEEIDMYGSEYKFNIGEVQDLVLRFKEVLEDPEETEKLENIPLWHPASVAYRTFKINDKDTVRDSALLNTSLAFNIFTNQEIKAALSNDGMTLSDINKKQSGYIIITSDKPGNSVYKPVLSLFFSFFFKDTMNNYDKQAQIAAETGGKNTCKGVTAMLEEFFSIGKINDFETVMTTCRSRHIYVSVIIQHIQLLEELYGKNNKNTIDSACDTTYFLGANDLDTMNYISKKAGNASILKESHHEENTFGSRMNTDVNVSTASRPLLTTEEVRMWNSKVLLIRKGMEPVQLETFPWTDHWVMNKEKYVPGYIHMDGYNVAEDSAMPYNKFIDPIEKRMEIINARYEENNPTSAAMDIALKTSNLRTLEKNEVIDIDVIPKAEHQNENISREDKQKLDIIQVDIIKPTAEKKDDAEEKNVVPPVVVEINKPTESATQEEKTKGNFPQLPSKISQKKPSTTGRNMRRGKAKKTIDSQTVAD